MARPRHVVLVGIMGSGKTAIGVPLAERLGRVYLDNDEELLARTGRRARDIAAESGIDVLHRQEIITLTAALARDDPCVIGAPAAAILDRTARESMEDEFVVWLDTDLDTLAARLRSPSHRPQIDGDLRAMLEQQYAARAPLYRRAASMIVDPGNDVAPVVDEIVRTLEAGG